MCIIMPSVKEVSNTNIFARLDRAQATQHLIYKMNFSANDDVAMTLPIPVREGTQEDDVKFVDLSGYPEIFRDMDNAFPKIVMRSSKGYGDGSRGLSFDVPLKVQEVGKYIASFVPTLNDFGRLDAQFRVPAEAWAAFPQYKDYGFVVFQLKVENQRQKDFGPFEPYVVVDMEAHPMAFTFPTASEDRLFYPTVHIHDGHVHAQEQFDHTLYFQDGTHFDVETSRNNAGYYIATARSHDLIDDRKPLQRIKLNGYLPNDDTLIRLATA